MALDMRARKVTLNNQIFELVTVFSLKLEAAKIHNLFHQHKINAKEMKGRKVTLNSQIIDWVVVLSLD